MTNKGWTSLSYNPQRKMQTYRGTRYPVTTWHKDTPHIKTVVIETVVDDVVMPEAMAKTGTANGLAKVDKGNDIDMDSDFVPVFVCPSCNEATKHYAKGMCRRCWQRTRRQGKDRSREYKVDICAICGGSVSKGSTRCRECYEHRR